MQVEIKIIRGEQFKEITVQSTERTFYMDDDILQNYDNGVLKKVLWVCRQCLQGREKQDDYNKKVFGLA